MTERAGAPAPGEPERSGPSVVATAGHVDHGKSSLVTRLTGMDPDRLEEEKRRGLTIELGYAWCTLPSGRELGFVDVPGHERFVRTMLAGVGPVPLVLFVVAADEGWRPQSEEHLEIVDVLGSRGAVIALTKRDLVEAAGLDRVRAEVTDRVRGTALEGAPIVACSSTTGEGFDELVAALDAMLAGAPEPDLGGRPRLHVDRVFSIRGSGTVVTGTLTGGPIATAEEVELLPSGTRARIRGLQTHHRGVGTAWPVSRVAVNLTADRTRIARGEVLAPAGVWTATSVLEARIEPVRSLDHPITSRGAFKLHAGAAERTARIRLYDVRQVSPEGAFVRIALSEPLVLDVGDRFVLRESGRRRTIAGGVVLDTDPPHRAGPAPAGRLGARARASRAQLPALLVAERRAVRSGDVRSILGTAPDVVEGAVRLGGWWVGRALSDQVGAATTARLAQFHASEPAAAGESIATTRRAIADAFAAAGAPRDLELADAVLDRLESEGTLAREGSLVRLASHRPGSEDEVAGVVEVVRGAEPTPPSIAELREAGVAVAVVEAAVRSGALVRISPEFVFTRELVERAGAIVREAGADGITLSSLRERLGTSRKYAVPLAEHLDRTGVTRRSGDLRFARGVTSAPGRSPAQPS
ncbi:MAG TPA: selenocysteine-specific translation elongation factor [Actinomycetota bacterium]|nr:selenocysteine-specific translation elongation factor [Actinomycetota bacterium]